MAEGGEEYYSSSEDDSDASLFDSDDDDDKVVDLADRVDGIQLDDDDEEDSDDVEEFLNEHDTDLLNEDPDGPEEPDEQDESEEPTEPDETAEVPKEEEGKDDEKPVKKNLNIKKFISFVNDNFYGRRVNPLHINILTDFVDAEIFLIDGDSLLFELLGEESLDWNHGGQFLHLTYLLERFLQYFTDKGGVFHIIFFKDMEIIWRTQPSMLLARQAIILHLQQNTPFTVVTSIANFWTKEWEEYVDDKVPAFMLLTDAETIPWKTNRTEKQDMAIEFFFRSLLLVCLGDGLNCVFISGIQMTATKVLGFYLESFFDHKDFLRKYGEPTWITLRYLRHQMSTNNLECKDNQIDFKEEVKTALQSPSQVDCRELATVLACAQVLCNVLRNTDANKEALKTVEDRMKLFVLHTVLLKKLPLKYRAQTVNSSVLDDFCKAKDGNVYPFNEIYTSLWKTLKSIEDTDVESALDMSSVGDLMDGRLVHSLFSFVLEQTSNGLEGDLINEAEAVWRRVVDIVNRVHPSDSFESQLIPLFAENVMGASRLQEESYEDYSVKLRPLLEVENVLVNEYAGGIRTKINAMAQDESEDEVFNIGREFDELYHWHSLKPLSDDYDRTKEERPPEDKKERKWYLIRQQKLNRHLRFYGDSLVGGNREAKVITVTDPTDPKKKKKGRKKEEKKKRKGKKAVDIIEKNKQKGKEKEEEKDQVKWQSVLTNIDSNSRKDDYKTALQLANKYESECKTPGFRLQALMKKAQISFDAWQQTRTCDPNSNDMKYPVLLVKSVQKIYQGFHSLLEEKDKKKLAGYMQKLGFDDVAATFYDLQPESGKRAGQHSVHMTSVRFQLEHMGHLLKREERPDRDPRVDHFIPDTWQRKLLDAVDNNESAVIVAPTSSGKTYASYYCMEKVMRQSNDGVVVYVSPTKALVNQVVATVYARFSKQLPDGKSVHGVFTRDYRHNTLNSQILITVPQCLEILFLSPRRQDWTKKVKYVIFDEVHCLGEETGAEVWEHLLLLIRCPFLALSATIGNPHDLMGWLQAAQDFREQQDKQDSGKLRKSYKIRLVTYDERYSDLEKSIYLPSPNIGGFSKETLEYEESYDKNTEEFVRLHPCAQLAPKQLRENGFPGDMALTPKETLQLYDVMVQEWLERESLQKLSPEKYFQEGKFIPKSQARKYEKELKKEFKSWADEKQMEKVQAVIQSMNSICLQRQASTENEWTQLGMRSFDLFRDFPKLVDQLRAQEKLPALVFSFNRKFCERLAEVVTVQFEEKEEVIRSQGGPRSLKLAEKRQIKAEKKLKRTRDRDEIEKERAKRSSKPPEEEEEKEDFSALNEPLPECTLAFTHGIGKQDLSKIMDRIMLLSESSIIKRGIKRGVSYHHSGLNAKIRGTVEMLFREKYLQVVAATGTLALGIHMPCKTVVFAGDSPFLNSLQYRQMSGRAGRRGFDPVGNVVFFGVPYRKVQRLITANIPKLVGNFPINVSLVLRLLLMTSKGDDQKDALTKALALLSHPFICKKHPEMESQIKKHFLFSVELLARLGLINKENGAPQEMAGLATHLHYHEPSNFVLVSFLQQGLFHDLCQPGADGKFPEDIMRKIVLVLSHLFGRRLLHPSQYKRRIHLCPTSKVILEDLPDEFAEALKEYNRRVTDVFSQYLKTVAAELEKDRGEEKKLPLSGIEFPDQASIRDLDEHNTIKSLARSSILYSACSSFTALSGNSDLQLHSAHLQMDKNSVRAGNTTDPAGHSNSEISSKDKDDTPVNDDSDEEDDEEEHREPIEHLLKIVRQDVYTDMNVVPTLSPVLHLNAYALDFFKHGSSKVIIKENGIQSGDVYTLLKDFYLVIKSISCSLEELGPETDNVVLAFRQLAKEFGEKFNKQFKKF